jgi:beta-lactamase regulating signal transducer with metallopeptidase domain
MNKLIEILNPAGEQAVRFAGSMLWQSSVLIGLLFVFEWVWRKKVRAGVRYAIWLIVLVKLLLPPSLALPTGLGWWLGPLWQTHQPRVSSARVNYGTQATAIPADNSSATKAPAHQRLSGAAIALLTSVVVSLGLLAWSVGCWRTVAREAGQAGEPPAWLEEQLDKTRRAVGLRRPMRLRLNESAVSPAVCGLLRPTLLLPRALSERLPEAQLRAVLLHELVHLKRKDVWVNCFQTLVQVVYWWHPLLWMANARIRNVREQAVDDAVMLAMGGEAESYAPTLVEVARLALRRPLASLGLVGILESHSSLRRRIERLINYGPPRKAGLTLRSLVCIAAFGAVALPMGGQPEKPHARTADAPHSEQSNDLAISNDPSEPQISIKARFISIPEAQAARFWQAWGVIPGGSTNIAKVLTPAQANAFLKTVEADPESYLLNESSVITLSGRQVQIQIMDAMTIVSNINPKALAPPGISQSESSGSSSNATESLYVTGQLQFGLSLDFMPWLLTDRWAVDLTTIPTLSEFLGYEKPANSVTVYVNGTKGTATPPIPRWRVQQVTDDSVVPDGHTLVLGSMEVDGKGHLNDAPPDLNETEQTGRQPRQNFEKEIKKRMLVLITPTIIDPAGNRLRPENKDKRVEK